MNIMHAALWNFGCLFYLGGSMLCLALSNLDPLAKPVVGLAIIISWLGLTRLTDRVPRIVSGFIGICFVALVGVKFLNIYINRHNPDYQASYLPPYIPELLEFKRTQNNEGAYQRLPSNLQLLLGHFKLSVDILAKRNLQHNQLYQTTLPGIGTINFYHSFEKVKAQIHDIYAKKTYAFRASSDEPHIIDCGSNIGISVMFFKHLYPNSTIIAFEPAPDSFAALERNIKDNHLTNITTHQSAVFDSTGIRKISRNQVHDGNTELSLLQEATGETIDLPCVKLSDYIVRDVDLLKMDIEGSEFAVMDDLMATKKIDRVKQIILEFHNVWFDADRPSMSTLLSKLELSNFEYQIYTSYGEPFDAHDHHAIIVFAYRKIQ